MKEKIPMKEKSLLSLYIFEILRKYSSKESPLSEKQIKEKLNAAEVFLEEIKEDDRKIIPRHIGALVEYLPGLIVKIDTAKNAAAKWYYDGSQAAQFEFLSRNNFTVDEIGFLVDMIGSSKLVTEKSTIAFTAKLLNSLNDTDEKILSARQMISGPKNENVYMHSIVENLQRAIDEQIALKLTLNDDENVTFNDVSAYSIYKKNDKLYVYILDDEKNERELDISIIKQVKLLRKVKDYDKSILDKLEDQGLVQVTDKEGRSLDSEISNDTLFTNSRFISLAINEKRYLSFKDYKCSLANVDSDPTERNVIPLTTIFKNGAYYLIAIEKLENNESPVFVRIDLMEDLKLGKALSSDDVDKINPYNKDSYLNTNSFILSKTRSVDIQFWIKKDAIQRATDEFGDEAYSIEDANPEDTADGNIGKLAKAFPEEFTKSFTGFEYGDELIKVEAKATEEDALRWCLENADAVELISPKHLRLKLLDITQALNKRYSKTEYDTEQEIYRKVISGADFLTYGARTKFEEQTRKRVANEKTFDKVTKLKIKNLDKALPKEELEKYINVEELVIDGNGVNDFSWIANLSALRKLTLINTSLKDGSVLAEIPQLDMLLINRNSNLESHDFLKTTRIGRLFVGENGKADVAALYEVTSVDELVIEENLLFDIDMERIWESQHENAGKTHHMSVRRWIDDFYSSSDMPRVYRLPLKK